MSLKKEFKQQDVNRLRNLITGKYGEKTRVGVGRSSTYVERQEGDVWEEDGKTWTISNGIRQNVTKLDKAKRAVHMPLLCPNCGKPMKNRNDREFYKMHGMCFDCVVEYEHKLRKNGELEEYYRTIQNDEIDNKIKEFREWIAEKLSEGNDNYVSESGEVERWVGHLDQDKVEAYVEEVIDYLSSLKT